MTRRLILTCGALLVLGTGCDLLGLGGGGDAGTGGGSAGTGGGAAGTGGGGGGGACTPLVCGQPGALCGQVSDGCGHPLNCGACACTTTTFATDCPSLPCQVATGCSNATCVYEPVTCGFQPCSACLPGADGGCGDASPRGCGAGCAADYCDPRPTTSNGKTVYANACVARADIRCGTCDLGALACPAGGADGGAQAASCQGVTLAGVNPDLVECNGASPSATILFVDPAATSPTHTGARDAPYLTLDEAVTAAAARGSRAIIIGGAPTFARALVLSSGVSVVGGYVGYPAWQRDPSRRPVFAVPAASLAAGRLVGLVATDITSPTEVVSVDIVTPDLPGAATAAAGASNLGALLQNASQLALVDVHFRVGAAQAGGTGAPGPAVSSSVPASSNGGNGKSVSFDVALQSFACSAASWTTILGGAGQAPTCGGAVDPTAAGGAGATVPRATTANARFFTAGSPSPGGAAGGLITVSGSTYVAGSGNGKDGAAYGSAATTGAGGTPSVAWVSGAPVPQGRGGTGSPGKNGIGGGGGGGGGSLGTNGDPTWCYTGGGGGAGGAGGCGGAPGTGGYPGGWSIGLAVSGSAGLVLQGVTVTAGNGGAGGAGGPGGGGTAGANGGSGGLRQPDSAGTGTDALFVGYPGGKGSTGQTGGTGGSGATGQTRGAICDGRVALAGLAASSASATFQASEGCN